MKLGTQVWAAVTVVVVVGLVLGGWFLGASPLLAAKSASDQSRMMIASQNQVLAAEIAALEAKKAELPELEARAAELEEAIPGEVGGAAFIRNLNDLATANGVAIKSITIADGTAYVAPTGEAGVEGAPVPVTNPLVTGQNFVLVPVTITAEGGWNELLAFVHSVQTGKRLVLITGLASSAQNGVYQFQISGTMYALQRDGAPQVDTQADSTDTTEQPAS